MKRLGVIVVTLLASLVIATWSPASAADGYTNAETVTLYKGCRYWDISYSVTLPPETDSWSLDISVLGPDGVETGSDYVYGDSAYDASGTAEHHVCSFQDAGRHTVEAIGEWCDYDYDCYPVTLPRSSFIVRPTKTRTTLTSSPRNPSYNKRITFHVRVRDERPNGRFFPSDGVDTILQVKARGKWVKVRQGNFFVYDGKDSLTYRWNVRGTSKFRALTKKQDNLAKSVSNVLTVR